MKNSELSRQFQALESLFKRTKAACGDDIEMLSHWAKYLCVICAGFLENAISEIYSDYCYGSASPSVAMYASRSLKKTQNPKCAKFIEIAGLFNKQWGENLTVFVNDNGRKEAIDSIMTNRHLIAHGNRSDITIARINQYFEKSVEVIEYIETQCAIVSPRA